MFRRTRSAAAALACAALVLALGAGTARADDAADAKAAAMAAAKAIEANDAAALKAVSTGSDADYKLMADLGGVLTAMGEFVKASGAKFGPELAQALEASGFSSKPLSASVEKGTVTVEGDTATLKDSPEDMDPLPLKKADGKWKVDFAQMKNKEQMGMMLKMRKPIEEVTAEIKADKHKDFESVQKSLQEKLKAAGIDLGA